MAILSTEYQVGEIPHNEYPRPQQERKEWLNLNGEWNFALTQKGEDASEFAKILVPFSPETVASKVGEGFTLSEGEMLTYQRNFTLEKPFKKDVTLLHFTAVDGECEVFVNGIKVGSHSSAFIPFTLDVSSAVKDGENEIKVLVYSKPDEGLKGKQSKNRGGIWYTEQSGINQTVWLESLCQNYIRDLKYDIDVNNSKVTLFAFSNGQNQTVTVYDNGRKIINKTFIDKVDLYYDYDFWSPENPKLYDVVITNDSGDEIKSYFGFRSFSTGVDKKGKQRLLLNGKPYFFTGILDQGYWPEGLLTYPSDKAVIDELTMLKNMGFNTIRKHIKIEPMRWYYHCDRLGLIVWQDFVNGGGEYKFTHVALLPFLGIRHNDNDYKYFARENINERENFIADCKATVQALYNCTSIGLWTIFNEGWGQFDSFFMTNVLKNIDDSRIIDSVSGWHDQGKEKTTLRSLHTYYTPLVVPKDTRPVILSEFGGYSMKIDGHVFDDEKEFGYKKFNDKQKLEDALKKLYEKKVAPLIKKGLCACIYTQVSDVEEEINGLVTYDRKIVKVDAQKMKEFNDVLMCCASECFE